jgi:hypothetical protein
LFCRFFLIATQPLSRTKVRSSRAFY